MVLTPEFGAGENQVVEAVDGAEGLAVPPAAVHRPIHRQHNDEQEAQRSLTRSNQAGARAAGAN